jgi:cytochrome c-type biogenesis protein CcmE
MTRKQSRSLMIVAGLAVLGLAVGLVLFALRGTIVFFYTPSDLLEQKIAAGQRIRLGGIVQEGTFSKGAAGDIGFAVTDTLKSIKVQYKGILPDLFREGQGVVAEGRLDGTGLFLADTVLAKHDETYMPPEVAKALKEKGVWKGADGKPAKPASMTK